MNHFPYASLKRQGFRFLLAGGLNTAITFLLYQFLLLWLPYSLAFSIAFSVGIVFTGIIYNNYVFEVRLNSRRFISNAFYYLISYGISLLLLSFLIEELALHERISIVITITLMVPVNFFCLRKLLLSRKLL